MTAVIEKFSAWLEKHFLPIATKIATQRHLVALRDGFIATMPISMFGAVVVMLNNVVFTEASLVGAKMNEIAFYAAKVQPLFNKTVVPVLNQIWWGTLALGIVFTVFTISYKLAEQYDQDPLSAGVLAVVAYFVLLPQAAEGADWGTVSWTSFNSEAIFTGLIVAFISTEMFTWVNRKGWVIKMPEQVPPAVSRAFSAIIPAGFVLTFFGIISVIFLNVIGMPVKDFINSLIQAPMLRLGQSPFTLIFLIFISQVLWFFGLHGMNIVDPILNTMYSAALAANAEAILIHNQPAPHAITRNMIDLYGMHGGSGATLGLLIAIFLFSRRDDYRGLAKMAIIPSLFQINEPVIYGLPIVLNPILAIPFMLVPSVTLFVGWFFTAVIPIAGAVYIAPPWVMPPVLNAFLATGGDFGAAFIGLLTLLISIVIYAPFVIMANKAAEAEQQAAKEELATE